MADADAPTRPQWPFAARALWVVLLGPLVAIAVGGVVAAVAFVAAALVTASDVRFVPILSLTIAAPFGVTAAVAGGIIVPVLGRRRFRGASRRRWLRAGVVSGAAVGLGYPLSLPLLGFMLPSVGVLSFHALAGTVAGGLSGAALGFIGWREFGAVEAR